MMRPAPIALRASMLVFLLLRSDGAAANLTTRIFVSSPVLGIATIEPTMNSVDGPLADDYHFEGGGPHGTGILDAQVEVDYGVIRIIAAGQIDADNYELGAVSSDSGLSADASFSDMVTISSVEYDGMLGTFVPVIRVTGELAGTASGIAIPFISFATANWLLNFASPTQQRSAICVGQPIPGNLVNIRATPSAPIPSTLCRSDSVGPSS